MDFLDNLDDAMRVIGNEAQIVIVRLVHDSGVEEFIATVLDSADEAIDGSGDGIAAAMRSLDGNAAEWLDENELT